MHHRHNNTGGKFANGFNDASVKLLPVSTGVNNNGGKFANGVNDTGCNFVTDVIDACGEFVASVNYTGANKFRLLTT